jgi:hypothetical protein
MDDSCLEHCLTPEEGRFYDDNGFLLVKDALTKEQVARLLVAADRTNAWAHEVNHKSYDGRSRLNLLDFIGLDDEFLCVSHPPHPLPPPHQR